MLSHVLTDKECDFLIELLTGHSEKLMLETRHTDGRQMRTELREEIRTCDRLVERLREMKAGLLTP